MIAGRCRLPVVLLGALAIAGSSLVAATAARAALSPIPARTSVTNGYVDAVVPTDEAIYIAGTFNRVGPPTGPGVGIDSMTARSTGLPEVTGGAEHVAAVARDGSGGFYIGGDFTHVGGVARDDLAHILANGTVDPSFNPPSPNNSVTALAASASTLYASGYFTSIGGLARNRIAAFDATTGAVTAWDANADCCVSALAVSGSTVYAGGFFTSIGGKARNGIAALNATTANATSWNPNASGSIYALVVSGSTVYAGGAFSSIGGKVRYSLAALNRTTGKATSWNPNAECCIDALAVSSSRVYAGGTFSSIGGKVRHSIAALHRTTGEATSWNPNAHGTATSWDFDSSRVDALAVSGSTVYAGGTFASIRHKVRDNLAAINATTGAATSWNPSPNEEVDALAVSGSTVYAGGTFSSIGGKVRHDIAALDPTTGRVTGWDPDAEGGPLPATHVRALAVAGSTVYAGGTFTSIGGKARSKIAALDATTGAATRWNPHANSYIDPYCDADFCNGVHALAVSGSTVYAGGFFSWIGGEPRNNIAALNDTGGRARRWNPNAHGGDFGSGVYALRVFGSTVYAGGLFSSIGGKPRHLIGAVSATTGRATSWNPDAEYPGFCGHGCPYVDALRVSGSTVYAGGPFSSIGGKSRNGIAALNTSTGAATSWNPNAYGNVDALALSGPTVYAGGNFTSIGGQARNNLAALNATTGAARIWNPSPNGGSYSTRVRALSFGPDGSLWVAGSFTGFSTAPQSGIARFLP